MFSVGDHGAGVSPCRRMISRSLFLSGGLVGLAALNTSAVSRKYSGPRAAGLMTQSDLESWEVLLSKRWITPRGMQSDWPGERLWASPFTVHRRAP